VIKGTSLAYNGIRSTKNDKSWTSTSLKKIAQKIAQSHGMGLVWDCEEDKKFTRVEQADQTDIAFLKKICQDAGCALKITGNKIVIYDQSKYEELKSIATVTCGDKSYIKWSFSTGEGETEYDMCTVKYTDPKTGKVITGSYKTEEWKKKEEDQADKDAEDKDKPEVLVIRNEKVSSVEEANALAEKRLKLANKFERKVSLTFPGNPNYCAGMTMQLKKFGYWSGKYLISKSRHDITSSGYTTTLTLRRVGKVETSGSAGGSDNPAGDNPFGTGSPGVSSFLGGNIDIQAIIEQFRSKQ
jgi:phage protein D